jgi:hypothetical protein
MTVFNAGQGVERNIDLEGKIAQCHAALPTFCSEHAP